MRRILQAGLLCTCVSSLLALGCRNSQQCCTPCCYPSAASQPMPAAATPVLSPAPNSPGQGPSAPNMPLVQNDSMGLPTAPSSSAQPETAVAVLTPPSPTAPQSMPLPPAGQPSYAGSVAEMSQEQPAPGQAPVAGEQQSSSAGLTASMSTPARPLPTGTNEEQAAGALTGMVPLGGETPGHDPAYHSLVGVLDYVAIQKGWVLRYAAPEEEDRYGGSVTLVGAGPMKGFKQGQRVQVSGELVDAASLKPHPAYRVFSLQPLGPQ